MNGASVCIAIAVVCALGPMTVRAETTSVAVAAGTGGVSSIVTVSVAGLSMASIHAVPGFPMKAFRDGFRVGRVVLGYTVYSDGTVGNVEVLEANPVQVFTRTATNALVGWRFAPSGASEQRKVEFRFFAE